MEDIMPKNIGHITRMLYYNQVAPFMIDLQDSAVNIVRECLRDFDTSLKMDENPIPFLLISGYDEAILTDLYHNNPEGLHALALKAYAKDRAAEIVGEIRRSQLISLHRLIQTQYPILANEWREVEDIKVDHLPPELKNLVLGSSFTPEHFVRAYLGNVANPKVYDLTPVWQQWAANSGLHPAYPKSIPTRDASSKPEESIPIAEDDPRLWWTTPFLGGDKQKAQKSLNVLIKSGILSRDFNENEFHNTRKNITGIHALKFSHPEIVDIPQKERKGRPPLSAKEANIAQRIFNAWMAGTDWDTITCEFSGALTEILTCEYRIVIYVGLLFIMQPALLPLSGVNRVFLAGIL